MFVKLILLCFLLLNISLSKGCLRILPKAILKEMGIYKCYEKELPKDHNCFFAWLNSHLLLPQSPMEQEITFRLYTRRGTLESVYPGDSLSLSASSWDRNLDTKFILHGFISGIYHKWIFRMADELLRHNVNVVLVDWNEGAEGPDYFQAAANCRVVGASAAYLVLTMEELGYDASRVHFIGHSLGAQISGYAGKMLDSRLGRISGLDPAAILFDGFPDYVKLTKKDAMFVDVIHTDAPPSLAISVGTRETNAHVDFFPNQGYNQPGCGINEFSASEILRMSHIADIVENAECSHTAAYKMFIASINVNVFSSYPCDKHLEGCNVCGSRGCCSMGYHANNSCSGIYFLLTEETYPFNVILPSK